MILSKTELNVIESINNEATWEQLASGWNFHQKLGSALFEATIVKGREENLHNEDIVKKLITQAEAEGADAVLLHEYAIVVSGSLREQQLLNMNASNKIWGDAGKAVSGWGELEEDFAVRYGTVGKKNSVAAPSTSSYRRIIRVEFLKFKSDDK